MSATPHHTDNESLAMQEGIHTGDEQAFRKLFDLYAPRLNRFAFSIVKIKEAATDIVDDVFIRVWKRKERISPVLDIKVYLYTAVKNSSLNYLSSKAHKQITEPFDFIDIVLSRDQSPEERMISTELSNKITEAVEELPARCKMVFKLVREDGLSYKNVAEILHLSVNTVDAQMVIAVKRISEKVQAHFTSFPKKSLKK